MGKTLNFIQQLYDEQGVKEIEFQGTCHDCGSPVAILTRREDDGVLKVKGGALWYMRVYAKCEDCYDRDPVLRDWQPCEVYSRVVGYMRPVKQWNMGKQAEWDCRVPYRLKS